MEQQAEDPGDKPVEVDATAAPHQQHDEGTSTANAQGAEDAGYIASYTAEDPPANQHEGANSSSQAQQGGESTGQPGGPCAPTGSGLEAGAAVGKQVQLQLSTSRAPSSTESREPSAKGIPKVPSTGEAAPQQPEAPGKPEAGQTPHQARPSGSASSASSAKQPPPSGSGRASPAAPPPGAQAPSQGQQQQGTTARGGSAKAAAKPTHQQEQQRPMSREGGGAAYAAQAEAAARSKAQAAEASGYVAPGLRLIDVEVTQGPDLPNRLLRVLMDYTQADPKPYMGGTRHKLSGTVFHHAATQTPKAPRYLGAEPKLERMTQTVKVKHHTAQTIREAATQMERPGLVLDSSNDVERVPGKYQTSEEWMEIVDRAVRTIQRWTRGWMGRKRAAYLLKTKQQREAFLREEEAKAQAAAEKHRQKEIERRMHPRTAADFEILYNELEAWRLQETYKIMNAKLPKEKEQLMLQQLLHKETKLLQTIDRLKINANHENKDVRIQRTLGEMSKPKTYELRNGTKVEVHTPFTTRAKELMQLYNGLNLPMLTVDERLDVLLHVKWTVKEFDCNLTREIVELVDREADLLNRGRSPKMLEGLRKRVSSLFLSFIETPEFNPVSAQFQVIPMDFEQYMFDKLEKSTAKSPQPKSTFATITRWD